MVLGLMTWRWTALARRGWHSLKRWLPWMPSSPLPRPPKRYSPDIARPLRAAADAAGVRVVSWTLDTDLTVQGEGLKAQRGYWQRGIATAHALGAEVLRVTTGGREGESSRLATAQQNLAELVSLAAGLQVAVENHHGLSSDPTLLAALLEAVPGAGCCLDFGNFAPAIRERALLAMAPHTVHVHAKSFAFNERGEETTFDYPAILGALNAAGYQGWFVIEYEGAGPPATPIQQTRALLLREGSTQK